MLLLAVLRPWRLRNGRLGPTWVSSDKASSTVPAVQEQLSISLLEENARLRRQIGALQLSQTEALPKQEQAEIASVGKALGSQM